VQLNNICSGVYTHHGAFEDNDKIGVTDIRETWQHRSAGCRPWL